jgi:3,4-dihydroxy 2-butanone 4-phosphate synthase / GTP cyclohydrolase II
MKTKLDSISEAIEDIRAGKMVIVVDDEDRENEGDFVAAAEMATPEMINFMALHGRGLICTPLIESRCKELDLNPMVTHNTDPHHTSFTVSVDLIGHGNTTGISAADRARTIQALIAPETKASDLARPGHIFPLIAKQGGVLRRTGHTEAAIDLARLAGKKPAGVIVEIMNEDGTMARLPQLFKIAEKFNLKIVSIEDLVAYRMRYESLIVMREDMDYPTSYGTFRLRAFEQVTNGQIHIALTYGQWETNEAVLVRMHSARMTNDILSLMTQNSKSFLEKAMKKVVDSGSGAIVYMNQQSGMDSSDLLNRLATYKKAMEEGADVPRSMSFSKDARDFGIGAQILHELGIKKVKLLTNNPIKRVGIVGYGLEIVENITMR